MLDKWFPPKLLDVGNLVAVLEEDHAGARAAQGPRGFQGSWLKDTVEGPQFEETKTQI